MAKASKPIDLMSKNLTKKEIQERKRQEERLKGNDDLIYKASEQLSKEEQSIYNFIVKELKSSEILSNLDIAILETTVDSIVKMKQCKKAIDKLGIVIVKEDGNVVKNPAITAYKDYNTIFNTCMRELGLSPSARSKLTVLNLQKQAEKEDPLLKILKCNNK